jgi:hypothetical protein
MRFYAPIAKVDAQERMVWGYASTSAEDDQGETITRDALAAALADYLKFANIREMHQMSAVGVAEEAAIDDRGLYVGARIVDPRAWDKVTGGVYKGFSIGGRVKARDPADRSVIIALTLTEISLVDRPANPEAVFDCWKVEGGDGMEADTDTLDHADPGYHTDGRPRYPLDSERHIRAAWAFIHMPANAAPYTAGELAQIKARIVAAWKRRIDPAGPPDAAGKAAGAHDDQAALQDIHDRLKALTDGACCEATKATGRHSKTVLRHLKAAHDALCRAGASCAGFAAATEENEADAGKAARADDLTKAVAAQFLPRLEALAKRIEEIAATPLPPLTVARSGGAISKREDGFQSAVSPDDVVAALARMSDDERTLALIKAAHSNPIRPIGGR